MFKMTSSYAFIIVFIGIKYWGNCFLFRILKIAVAQKEKLKVRIFKGELI